MAFFPNGPKPIILKWCGSFNPLKRLALIFFFFFFDFVTGLFLENWWFLDEMQYHFRTSKNSVVIYYYFVGSFSRRMLVYKIPCLHLFDKFTTFLITVILLTIILRAVVFRNFSFLLKIPSHYLLIKLYQLQT